MPSPTISSLSSTTQAPSGAAPGAGLRGGAAPTGSVLDTFSGLIEFTWKNVQFPVTEFDTTVRQDLVIHRFTDRNGAYVEGTGRHPVEVTATIPFLNYIRPAGQETWIPGGLYPFQWRLFLMACLQGTSGELMHPELGPLNCKVELARTTWSGKTQGGVWVHATWLESDDTQADQLNDDLSNASPTGSLPITAEDLDQNIATLEAAVGAQAGIPPTLEFSFTDLANFIAGVFDTTTLLSKEFQGRVQNVIYEADRVEDSVSNSPLLGPLAWPLIQGAERAKDAAWNIRLKPPLQTRKVLHQALAKDATLSEAAYQVGADVTDFITLNYPLVSLVVIPRGTEIFYYADAA